MASTSYSTDGAPVPAATTNPGSPSDYVQRGATGAGGATSAQESTYDARRRRDTPDIVGGRPPRRWHCGIVCGVAVGVLVVLVLTSRGAA